MGKVGSDLDDENPITSIRGNRVFVRVGRISDLYRGGSRATPMIFPEPLPFRHDYGCVGPRDKGCIPVVHVIC